MPTIYELIIAAFAGFIFSNLRKFVSIRRKGATIDYSFTLKQYVNMDWDIMLTQLIPIMLCLMAWELVPAKYMQYGIFIFAAIGAVGAEVLNTFFSRAESWMVDKIKNFTPEQKPVSFGEGPGGSTNPDPGGLPPKPR